MGNLTTGFKKFLQNKNTVTVVGVVLAIFVLYFAYTMRINSAINPISVPYAIKQINAGTQITEGMIGTREVPPSMLKEPYGFRIFRNRRLHPLTRTWSFFSFASSTASFAPSTIFFAMWTPGTFASRRMRRPSSTFVPSRRAITGTRRPTTFAASTMPAAMTSHLLMPPKILTKTLWT